MTEADVYRTNTVLSLACFAVYYFFPSSYWLLAGVGFLVLTLMVYPVGELIARGWMKFASIIGAFNAKVILFLLFYVALTPWAFFVRLIRTDPLKLSHDEDRSSTFEDRDEIPDRADFERIS